IHHLLLTLEAGLTPMKEYYGYCIPDLHCVFDYDNVTIFFKMSEFRKAGKQLIPIYLKKKEQIWKDFYFYASTLGNHKTYQSFYKNYVNFWKVAYITELVSFYIDSLLKEGEQIVIENKSFTDEYEDALWKLAKEAEIKGIKKVNVGPIVKKYFWIRNSYYGIHRLTDEEVISEIKAKMHKIKPISALSVEPTSISKELVQVGKDMILMQDLRKKYMMQATYYMHEHLKKIGKLYNISSLLMEETVPSEVLQHTKILKFIKEELNTRLKSCTITTSLKQGIKIYSGQKTYPKGYRNSSKVEIRGMVACGGKAVGRAKIIKNMNEIYKVNHGDVIVSPMTSPDLMPAIRRCVAIVTDFGGITCHAAIVAREFNIPCIVGTTDATTTIQENDLIEVDANTGVVRVLNR
ncbi:MAG: PEP-utilizing enzyme, partial [bacterium]|nr:PEP-utilizing enzyme [bacterium]